MSYYEIVYQSRYDTWGLSKWSKNWYFQQKKFIKYLCTNLKVVENG